MNGLYGLKPSVSHEREPSLCFHILKDIQSTRLPYQDVSVSTEGQEHVPSVIGPMSRNIESLIATTKAVIDAAPWNQDPKCCPVQWRSEMFEEARTRPLVIAVMRDDGVVRPHPPITRVLDEVAKKLELAGHEIVSWIPGNLHQECINIMVSQHHTKTRRIN
jgi:amidase